MNNKVTKLVMLYSVILAVIFSIIFWISANNMIYSVSIPAIKGILLIVLAVLFVGGATRLAMGFSKKQEASKGRAILEGLLGGLLIGAIGGGLGGLLWGILLNAITKVSYWDTVSVFAIFFLVYGGILGLIFGTIGYPIILNMAGSGTKITNKEE